MPTFPAPDGTRLHYRVHGDGEPLLVVPGGPMRSADYLGDLGGLSERRSLALLDLRGTGASAAPADPASYRCDRQVGDVEALRAELGLDRIDLLGHSAGAELAVLYAARHPGRIRTLTLVTPGLLPLGLVVTGEQRREAVAARAGEPWYPAAMEAFDRAVAGTATDADWELLTPFTYGRWDAAAQAHAAAGARQSNDEAARIYRDPAAFDPAATAAALTELDAPVLVMAGELDGGPRPETVAAAAAFFPKGTSVVRPGAGHFPWLDDPAGFTAAVAAFIG